MTNELKKMSSNLISKHKTHTEKDGNEDKTEFAVAKGAEEYENIVGDIENYVKEESFYELPTKKILEIISKSDIDDDELLCEVISRMNAKKRRRVNFAFKRHQKGRSNT